MMDSFLSIGRDCNRRQKTFPVWDEEKARSRNSESVGLTKPVIRRPTAERQQEPSRGKQNPVSEQVLSPQHIPQHVLGGTVGDQK